MRAETTHSYMWRIVERFYRSRFHFLRIHDRYEDLVAEYVEKLGTPRNQIRLQPRELSQLLSYKELEVLRDEFVEPLKDACHALFRTRDSTEFLDRIVNDIFHELSILKEEHYNVLTYDASIVDGPGPEEPAPAPPEPPAENGAGGDDVSRTGGKPGGLLAQEQRAVLDEVHDVFPQKVHRLAHLYEVALRRLERILPNHRDDEVLIRCIFLHRDRFVARSYDKGLIRFYELMYGESQAYEGFRAVGDSFYHAGFYDEAIVCYDLGEQYLQSIPPNAMSSFGNGAQQAREHFAQQKKKALRHLEQPDEEGTTP